MTLAHEHLDSIEVLDAVIADMRASGDTGHVENLLQVRTDFSDLIESIVDETRALIEYRNGCGAGECKVAESRVLEVLARIEVTP